MSDHVSLEPARAADASLLSNLLELYIHDMSVFFTRLELGADGRFGYAKLPVYFSEPERHFAYLIRHGERVVGFALAARGSPVSDDPEVHVSAIRKLLDGGVTQVYVHSGQKDQRRVIDFYGSKVLPRLRRVAVATAS